MIKRKIAIFDVDGTIFDGNLGIEFAKVLVADKVFSEVIGENIFAWYKKYKSGEVEKSIAVDKCYEYYNLGLKGLSTDIITVKAIETWEKVNNKLYTFANKLIMLFKHKAYEVVILSGSPSEMISLLGKHFEISTDNVIAGISEINDTIFTGKAVQYPGSSEDKINAIYDWANRNSIEIDWENSFAYGDNERDLGLFKLVGNAFVINPSHEFKNVLSTVNCTIALPDNILKLSTKRLG